jgi:predicted Zn-dependent peptidase
MRSRHLRVTAAALLGCAAAVSSASAVAGADNTGVKVPPHQRLTLPNGVKLILLPRHNVPLIAFDAVVRGGARFDPPSLSGVASLTAQLLTHGAGARDAYAFADAVEGAGGSLDADAGSEALLVHGQFLARDRDLMLGLLADALLRPRFDEAELEKLRARRIELIKAAKDSDPQSLLGSYGRALLFEGHPYARPVGGSESGLAAITRADVLEFYRQQFGADRLTLVFAGDFDPDALKAAAMRAFAATPKAAAPLLPLPQPQRRSGRRVWLIDSPGAAQTYFWIANVGVARSYPQRAALDVSNSAFGGSFGSMLMKALRSRTGLTYSASARFNRGSVAGDFAISSFTQTASTERAVALALATLGEIKTQGVAAASIASARSYILGQYPLRFETAADWSGALADLDLYDLPESYVNDYGAELRQVDAAACARVVAEAFPAPEDVDIVLIGDAARIREAAAKFGVVAEKSLSAPDFQPPGG